MNTKFARELTPGDLIMVCYGNKMIPGIFAKFGKKGNLNYWMISELVLNTMREAKVKTAFYTWYTNRPINSMMCKLDPVNLVDDELRTIYFAQVEVLKENGKI